jgi:nicotinic acid mononucleotide adenylyltransferase
LAVEGEPGFAVSLVDAPKPMGAPNYTLETLFELAVELAPSGSLFCLIGSDSFFGLRRWHRGAEIPFVAQLIVASRPGQPLDDLVSALPAGLTMNPAAGSEAGLSCFVVRNGLGSTAPLYLLTGLDFDVSASHVREQIRRERLAGKAAPVHVPAAVMDYICAHELYR